MSHVVFLYPCLAISKCDNRGTINPISRPCYCKVLDFTIVFNDKAFHIISEEHNHCSDLLFDLFLQANVVGALCDECKIGAYHLSADNTDGCLQCFCMGVTKQCASSTWSRDQVTPSRILLSV